jgi:hypothetical protein
MAADGIQVVGEFDIASYCPCRLAELSPGVLLIDLEAFGRDIDEIVMTASAQAESPGPAGRKRTCGSSALPGSARRRRRPTDSPQPVQQPAHGVRVIQENRGGGITAQQRGGLLLRARLPQPGHCVMYSIACDITDAANDIAAEGERVDPADPATISPYITHTVRRFGNWTLNLSLPDRAPTTRLDLEPRVLFAPTPAGN